MLWCQNVNTLSFVTLEMSFSRCGGHNEEYGNDD
jgi:hypothetical protein